MNPENFQLLWSIIHKYAIGCKTPIQKQAFKLFILNLSENFPCETCKPHFKKMINDVKMEDFEGKIHNGQDVSCFYWTFHMHNLVNLRLGKKLLSLDEAYNIHTDVYCTECDAIGNKDEDVSGKVLKYVRNHSRKSHEISSLVSLR